MFFTCKNFIFSNFTWKKCFAPRNGGVVGWCTPFVSPYLSDLESRKLYVVIIATTRICLILVNESLWSKLVFGKKLQMSLLSFQ